MGAGFIVQGALGTLPTTFGILDGMTHITAGFLALSAALGLTLWGHRFRQGLWIANLFGLLDILAVATGIAFVLLDTIDTTHPMFIAVFFVAPVCITFHVASLWQACARVTLPTMRDLTGPAPLNLAKA